MTNPLSVWILGDQLLNPHPAIEAAIRAYPSTPVRVLIVESQHSLHKRPYQRKKLVLILSAMRHYADRLRAQGYAVDYVSARNFAQVIAQHVGKWRSRGLFTMASADFATRAFQRNALSGLVSVPVTVLPNTQFLVEAYSPFSHPESGKRYLLEYFYRAMRRHFNVLMESDGSPCGGRWNYDAENRKPLPKNYEPRGVVSFAPDSSTLAVMDEVEHYDQGIGTVAGFNLGVTHEQAQAALREFIEQRLPDFGRYEDAMSSRDGRLNHSGLSAYVNLGLLEPMQMIQAAIQAWKSGRAAINSVEGFIRQVLGWREYMYWQYWRQMPGLQSANQWRATRSVPKFFWNARTEMNCLRHVIERVIETGYSHHIERLMVISNFCLLARFNPAAVTEWFLQLYIDAYDWVMQPNVIGMGLNADEGKIGTKPYIASANYINRMSDYCKTCVYKARARTGSDACPFNFLYWAFLTEHEEELRSNPRVMPALLGLRRIPKQELSDMQAQAHQFLDQME